MTCPTRKLRQWQTCCKQPPLIREFCFLVVCGVYTLGAAYARGCANAILHGRVCVHAVLRQGLLVQNVSTNRERLCVSSLLRREWRGSWPLRSLLDVSSSFLQKLGWKLFREKGCWYRAEGCMLTVAWCGQWQKDTSTSNTRVLALGQYDFPTIGSFILKRKNGQLHLQSK